MTTPHALHWDILRWNFDVEHLYMILRHSVQYRGLLLGLPILVLECSKWDQLEREACQRGWKIGSFRGQTLMKWTEAFMEQSQPLGPSFPPGFTPRVLRRYVLPCKTLSSGPKVARFCEGVKKHNRVTIWQVNKIQCRQSANLILILLILLMTAIWSTKLWTAFSHYCLGWSGLQSSGLPSLTTAEDDLDRVVLLLLDFQDLVWWGLPRSLPLMTDCILLKPCILGSWFHFNTQ